MFTERLTLILPLLVIESPKGTRIFDAYLHAIETAGISPTPADRLNALEAEKTEKDSQTDLSMPAEDIFQSVTPAQYSVAFYDYWARNGIKTPDLTQKLEGSIPESTVRQKLREAKERIKHLKTPLDGLHRKTMYFIDFD